MQEKTLVKLSLIMTLLGLSFLFVYAQLFDLEPAADIDDSLPSEKVLMKGTVKNLQVTEKAVFFELEGEKIVQTNIILFPDSSIYLREDDHVELTGQVEEYKGEKEVIAEKIVLK
ncbi:OB-fold nucleic acid binding domain-containing protein [Candidatus Woesearchaeota archaeon]|nr:OB-fold nucleic acid binding domain-containing protein [Candidatus Woesearchaeota archaeon]